MIRYSNKDDATLLRDAESGNDRAFGTLVERYQGRIATVVIGMLGNTPETADVGQEVFIRFHKSLTKFKGKSKLGTYLIRIAINLSLNELKKRQKQNLRVVSLDITKTTTGKHGRDLLYDRADEATNPGRTDTNQMVQKALRELESNFRSVVVLRLIEGYSTKEVAVMLQLPLGTVLSRLARGQKKLKKLLTPLIQ